MSLTRPSARATRLLMASLALAGLPMAQTEGSEPDFGLPGESGLDEMQQEMIQLFHEVERTLESIDIELYDASAGRIPVPTDSDSGIDRLLRSSNEKSDEAVTGIERILEIAQEMGAKGGT
jgi:hypothetical protein